ncbi:hypothetical protein BdWA1_002055 [Babesia duncani]|uniref:Uncharacterized protein n=1 Tax=Babesia duncani TaxID=323732 RepID=A0AAD9PLL3_9APIC|nr:hypothetical protein BdWA1_002055 [Babesia duncani]
MELVHDHLILKSFFILLIGILHTSSSYGGRAGKFSFSQMRSTRWTTCTSCLTSTPSSMDQAKMEVLNLRDKVDFQFTNFINIMRENCAVISKGVDTNYLQQIQKACEDIEEKLQEVNAAIKQDHTEYAEKLTGDDVTQVKDINNKCKNIMHRVERFVFDGISSFKSIFITLSNEYKMHIPESGSEKESKKKEIGLIQIHQREEKEETEKSKVKEKEETEKIKSNPNDEKIELIEPASEENVNKPENHNDTSANNDKEIKPSAVKEAVVEKKKEDSEQESERFTIDLERVPASAIVRVMESFKTDLKIESEKLLPKVLLNAKS